MPEPEEQEPAPLVTRRRLRVTALRAGLALVVLGALLVVVGHLTALPPLPPGVAPFVVALVLLLGVATTVPLSLVEGWLAARRGASPGRRVAASGLVVGLCWAAVAVTPFMLDYAQAMLTTRDVGRAADSVLGAMRATGLQGMAPWLAFALWAGVTAGLTLLLRLELEPGARALAIVGWLAPLGLVLLPVHPGLSAAVITLAAAAALGLWGLCYLAGVLDVVVFGYPDSRGVPDGF